MVDKDLLKIDWEKVNSLELEQRANYFDNLANNIYKMSKNASDCIKVSVGSRQYDIKKEYKELFLICYNEFIVSKTLAGKMKGKSLEEKMNYLNTLAKRIAGATPSSPTTVSYGNKTCTVDAKYALLFRATYREFNKAREQLRQQNKPTIKIDYEMVASLPVEKRADYFASLLDQIYQVPLREDAEIVTIDDFTEKVNKVDKEDFIACYMEFNKARREINEQRAKKIIDEANTIKGNKERMDYYLDILTDIVSKKDKGDCIKRNIGSNSYMIDRYDESIFDVAVDGYTESQKLYTSEIHQLSIQHEYKINTSYVNSASLEEKRQYLENLIDKIKKREIFDEGVVVTFEDDSFEINKIDQETFIYCSNALRNIVETLTKKDNKSSETHMGVIGLIAIGAIILAGLFSKNNKNTTDEILRNTPTDQQEFHLEEFNAPMAAYMTYDLSNDYKTEASLSTNASIANISESSEQDLIIDENYIVPPEIGENIEVDDYTVSEYNLENAIENDNESNENEEYEVLSEQGLDNDNDLEGLEETEEIPTNQDGSTVESQQDINDDKIELANSEDELARGNQKVDTPSEDELQSSETYEKVLALVLAMDELPEETIINENLNADKPNEDKCEDGYHLTSGNTTYNLPLWEALETMDVASHEAKWGSYNDALGVFSTFANRLENGQYGNSFHEILSRPNQFSVWNQERASALQLEQVPAHVLKAYYDCFCLGIRNVDTVQFRASWCTSDDRFQVVSGGNNYFDEAKHLDREDTPKQNLGLSLPIEEQYDSQEVGVVLSYSMEDYK